jgi:hypothetical protein
VVSAEAEVDAEEIEEAVYRETGTSQESECKGEFADDEGLPQTMATRSDPGPIAFLERLAGIDAGGVPGGRA